MGSYVNLRCTRLAEFTSALFTSCFRLPEDPPRPSQSLRADCKVTTVAFGLGSDLPLSERCAVPRRVWRRGGGALSLARSQPALEASRKQRALNGDLNFIEVGNAEPAVHQLFEALGELVCSFPNGIMDHRCPSL